MPELATVALLALLPPAGTVTGALVAEWVPVTDRWLSRGLHMAAGVVIAVVAIEIFPDALDAAPGWVLGLAAFAGGLLFLLAQRAIGRWADADGASGGGDDTGQGGGGQMWMIYLATVTDLFADGLLIGAGTSVSPQLGIALALGQVLADGPEGFATIFTLRANEVPRSRRLKVTASFFVWPLVAAAIAFLLLRGASEAVQYTALVVTAGLFLVAGIEDMIQEAHEVDADSATSTLSFIGGFALFGIVSSLLA